MLATMGYITPEITG
eukprot:s13739_g1.t1